MKRLELFYYDFKTQSCFRHENSFILRFSKQIKYKKYNVLTHINIIYFIMIFLLF